MQKLFTAILFSVMLAGVSFAQTVAGPGPTPQRADKSTKPRLAVIEFTVEPKAAGIAANGTQTLQNGVATTLGKVSKIEAISVKQSHSTAIQRVYMDLLGRPIDTATAVKIGKLLGVKYVMTGSVTEYGVTDVGARGRTSVFAVKAQLINVSTGAVVWEGEKRQETPAGQTAGVSGGLATPGVINWLVASARDANLFR